MDTNKPYEEYDGNQTPEEFANDFLVETSPAAIEEFPAIPTEYVNMPNAEFGREFGEQFAPEDEQVATFDGFNNFDNLYVTNNSYDDSDYEVETADDLAYDAQLSKEVGYNVTENVNPSEVQASTTDELHSTPTKACATERCKLDDYEIISDVLGSEKQIVKLYSTALCEASEEIFRNVIRENLDEAAADQYKAFEFMQKRGMYPTEHAQENDIIKAKQSFGPLCGNNCECKNGYYPNNNGCECSTDCGCETTCYCGTDCDCD
ncbi:MAG: spore coat protein [Clostridiales bacterium]|nr:spore coat protein [Clostridiales bacterium]